MTNVYYTTYEYNVEKNCYEYSKIGFYSTIHHHKGDYILIKNELYEILHAVYDPYPDLVNQCTIYVKWRNKI